MTSAEALHGRSGGRSDDGARPRLRFAPSPTGELHVGNARTALVNWLVARGRGGTFVLRIEDTDVARSATELEASMLEDLRWLGLDWDEGPGSGGSHGPYRQSEKLDRYRGVADILAREGLAYPCFCGPEELQRARERARARGESARYPGTCRDLPAAEVERRTTRGERPALRFRVPDGPLRFVDGLRGETGVAAGEIGDFVVLRADGTPTYHLACVVDDHDMTIDHVVRGADHLSNTPRHVALFDALGWPQPGYTHLPLVLGPDRSPLSKRHGATSVADLRRRGIVAPALLNYLALLGWGPPSGEEVLDLADVVAAFEIEAMAASPVVFDVTKLEWLNGRHLSRLPPEDLLAVAEPFLQGAGWSVPRETDSPERVWWRDAVELVADRLRRLDELADALAPFFEAAPVRRLDAAQAAELRRPESAEALRVFAAASEAGELLDESAYHDIVDRIRESTGLRGRALFHPLRLALTGREAGPELSRMVPSIERGARLSLRPPVVSVAERLHACLEASPEAGSGGPG